MVEAPSSLFERRAEGEGWLAEIQARWWTSLIALLVLWAIISVLLFPLLGLVTTSVTAGILLAPIVGLAAAGAIGDRLELLDPVDEARRGAPLWARLIVPIPVFAILWLLFFVGVGALFSGFLTIAGIATVLALAATAGGVWFLGLYGGLVETVRDSSPEARLGGLILAGVLAGSASFAVFLAALDSVPIALASLVPVGVLAAFGLARAVGWGEDAYETIASGHFGLRLAGFLALEVLMTIYVALLLGPSIPDARFTYAIAIAIGLAVLIPVSAWVRTWRDAWEAFLGLGEGNRLLVLLPTFPLAAALVFGLIVVLTDSFEAAYIVSVPVGIAALLALGLPLGVTRQIAPVVRRRNLPERSAIFVGTFALLSAYAYFAIALVIQNVEISLVGGMAFAGLVLGLVNWRLDLDRGLGEEFEGYGAPAEAGVLAVVFVVTLALAFLAIALTTGDFRLAFLASVVVAAAVNYLIAHSTGLVDSMRAVIGEVPWWGDLAILAAVFVGTTLYGTLAVGLFVTSAPVALSAGVVLGLASIVLFSRDLAIGEDVMESAEEEGTARGIVLALAFLGGFLAGLYVSAALLSVAGSSIFGFPLFIALLVGAGATIGLARSRDWDEELLGRVRSRTDKLKVATILVVWLGVGVLTGFAFTMLPIGADDLGLGSSQSLPLTVALAAGMLAWVWLPAVLFQAVRVRRGPGEATLETRDRSRALASAGWGLLAFAIVLVVALSVLDSPVIGVGAALAVGYLVALVISTRRTRDTPDDT